MSTQHANYCYAIVDIDSRSFLFEIVWCAASYLDKIVQHYLLTIVPKWMHFYHWCREIKKLLKKIPFGTFYICFIVYSGSAQNLPPCPIIASI